VFKGYYIDIPPVYSVSYICYWVSIFFSCFQMIVISLLIAKTFYLFKQNIVNVRES